MYNGACCDCAQEVMHDPVMLDDGYSYEKEAIQQWLSKGNDTSPMTNQLLSHKQLTPNHMLRSAAEEWQASNQKACV